MFTFAFLNVCAVSHFKEKPKFKMFMGIFKKKKKDRFPLSSRKIMFVKLVYNL
jgi:hypothetical protein